MRTLLYNCSLEFFPSFFSPTVYRGGLWLWGPTSHSLTQWNYDKYFKACSASHTYSWRKKGFAFAAVSFATSTLETWVVALRTVWTELASVPMVLCILLLHTAHCSLKQWGLGRDKSWSCSPSGICGRRDWLPQPPGEFPEVLELQTHFLFARKLSRNCSDIDMGVNIPILHCSMHPHSPQNNSW